MHHDAFDVFSPGQLEHGTLEDFLANRAKATRAGLALEGERTDGAEGVVVKRELDAVIGKQFLVVANRFRPFPFGFAEPSVLGALGIGLSSTGTSSPKLLGLSSLPS
jgi:hypothetical protein